MSKFLFSMPLSLLLTATLASFTFAQDVTGPAGSDVFVRVTQNREISGIPLDLAEIKVTTSFGEVAIPLAKIDGIKMHADGNDASVIAFKNGDLVTGKITLEVIKLKTDWGTAHINTSQIVQVTADKNARFISDTASTGAKSWRFQKIPASQAPAGRTPATNGFGR